jgi:hypothetical protein
MEGLRAQGALMLSDAIEKLAELERRLNELRGYL